MVDDILKYSEKVFIWPEVIREPGKIRPISIDNMHSQLQVTYNGVICWVRINVLFYGRKQYE